MLIRMQEDIAVPPVSAAMPPGRVAFARGLAARRLKLHDPPRHK